ncbi:rhodanese [Rosenbergiella australiborealis]|uniref:Rhodanese n=1 Tax=Rosenbergiella australiborealis TaxID=1544696 RepID=A0ABS5T2Y6_9GAMM|nr:rhodanese-like domain-containing protein [Rosenbergiella australiborealis]MBT0726724.1 rhodanese [Rosenbergiella australiborealis]
MTDTLAYFATPNDSTAYLKMKLAYYIDAWDLAEATNTGDSDYIVLDVRSAQQYAKGHIPGAINFPHREMNETTLNALDSSRYYVTYCDGIGCNGSTKGALHLAQAGLRVKELIGGLDFWRRDNHPIVQGSQPQAWPLHAGQANCGC